MISDTELRDVGADCSDDPGDLVAEHRRRRNEIVRGEQQVGVTEPGGLHVDQNFAPIGAAMSMLFKSNPRPSALTTSAFIRGIPYVQAQALLQMVRW